MTLDRHPESRRRRTGWRNHFDMRGRRRHVLAALAVGTLACGQHAARLRPYDVQQRACTPIPHPERRLVVTVAGEAGSALDGATVDLRSDDWSARLTTDAQGMARTEVPDGAVMVHVGQPGFASREVESLVVAAGCETMVRVQLAAGAASSP